MKKIVAVCLLVIVIGCGGNGDGYTRSANDVCVDYNGASYLNAQIDTQATYTGFIPEDISGETLEFLGRRDSCIMESTTISFTGDQRYVVEYAPDSTEKSSFGNSGIWNIIDGRLVMTTDTGAVLTHTISSEIGDDWIVKQVNNLDGIVREWVISNY